MGFSLFANNGKIQYGIKNYIADTADDLINIPKIPGYITFVIDESKYYIVNHSGQWVEKKNETSNAIEPEGTLSISENGIYNVASYAQVEVNIPTGIVPSGQIILTNPDVEYDVTNYSTAIIDIPMAEESEF